jgi:MoaA/NifB/PqqE/SkfB family radical SAM enzyme
MNWTTDKYNVELPEIFQIELSSFCNLECPACLRFDPRVRRPQGDMDINLISKMLKRGDFKGSYFVELQMYGEPTINPRFNDIVDMLHGHGFKIGMSTNGMLLSSMENCGMTSGQDPIDVSQLDYLTISIDSPYKETYEKLRLIDAIDEVYCQNGPLIDLQVIKFGGKSELPDLIKLAESNHWDVMCREVPDCGVMYRGEPCPTPDGQNQLCLNPWLSVSVQWDGDACPCCFSAGKHIVYGNLWEHSLAEIWQTSEARKKLMYDMRTSLNMEGMPCALCYMRSPALFHQKMLMERMKR